MEFYAAERKKEFIPFAMAWMELESIMLSEIEDESLALNGLGTSKEVKA